MKTTDVIQELEYIAASPAEEWGGFAAPVIKTAKDAVGEIRQLQHQRDDLLAALHQRDDLLAALKQLLFASPLKPLF